MPEFWYEGDGLVARVRYACCGLVVAAVFGLIAFQVESRETGSVASDNDPAVLVDLPPSLASSAPEADQMEAPASPPPVAATPKPEVSPKDESPAPKPSVDTAAVPTPPPPLPPPQAQSDPVQPAQVLGGSAAPTPESVPLEANTTRGTSAKAIARWQRAMVAKLELAKHRPGSRPRESGVVEIAFAIDRQGRLLQSAIKTTSGNRVLDDLALKLIASAAPFAPPPPEMNEAALAFTIPVRFNSR